jgi:hypothetical protein
MKSRTFAVQLEVDKNVMQFSDLHACTAPSLLCSEGLRPSYAQGLFTFDDGGSSSPSISSMPS